MAASFIKLMSLSICIAKDLDNKILETLLSDYAKKRINAKKYLLMHLLIYNYASKDPPIQSSPIYKILRRHIEADTSRICKFLIYD